MHKVNTNERPTGDELAAMYCSGVRIWEDNSGGLHIEPVGTGWMVSGAERGAEPGMALTDARLWGDWHIDDEDIAPAWEADTMTLVAELRSNDEWRTYDEQMGQAARRYIHGED